MRGPFRTGSGRAVKPGEHIAAGAAGVALTVQGDPGLILKLLDSPSRDEERRIQAMLSIDVPHRVPGADAMIAWPTDLVFDSSGYVGFLMPRAPEPAPVNLSTLALRTERERRLGQNIGWDTLLTITANYSAAVAALHACSVIVGDINLKNVVVSGNLTVTAIDCDSAQIEVGGKLYPCAYFQEEFLAPELKSVGDLRKHRREETSDRWALAVLIWMTLMEGHHPFAGVWQGAGDLDLDDHVAAGRFPYAPDTEEIEPSQHAPPWRALPPELQRLFLRAFAKGARDPGQRPAAIEWSEVLRTAGKRLKKCSGESGRTHCFPATELSCPWCEYEGYIRPQSSRSGSTAETKTASTPPTRPHRTAATGSATTTGRAAPAPPPLTPRPTGSGTSFTGSKPSGASKSRRGVIAIAAIALLVVLVAALSGGGDDAADAILGGGDDASAEARAQAPARAIRAHYEALDDGEYKRAFKLMTPSYRRDHHRWPGLMRAALPSINLVWVGQPRRNGRRAWVAVIFFARDGRDTARSDRLCRRFAGKVHMIQAAAGWRYDPTETFAVRELQPGAAGCP